MYMVMKHIHMLTAILSIVGFMLRCGMKFKDSPWLQKKITKILPHVNDTILLASAIYLAVITGRNPLDHHWLLAKIILLFAYIGFGMVALKSQKKQTSAIFFIIAVATFGTIMYLAKFKPF